MMEILFRGKRVDNGEWVYGDFYRKRGLTGIIWIVHDYMISTRDGMEYQVIPETIGQYTGLDDKNGVKIFDGDIVENGETVVYANRRTERFVNVGIVSFDVKNGCMVIHNTNGTTKRFTKKTIDMCKIKIIGNVTFNLELLGGVE